MLQTDRRTDILDCDSRVAFAPEKSEPDHLSKLLEGQIVKAQFLHNEPHLRLDPVHLGQPELMDLRHCHVCRGVELQTLFVEIFPNLR